MSFYDPRLAELIDLSNRCNVKIRIQRADGLVIKVRPPRHLVGDPPSDLEIVDNRRKVDWKWTIIMWLVWVGAPLGGWAAIVGVVWSFI